MGEATWVNRGGHRLDRGSWSSGLIEAHGLQCGSLCVANFAARG